MYDFYSCEWIALTIKLQNEIDKELHNYVVEYRKKTILIDKVTTKLH